MKQLYIALLLHSILSIHSLQAQERHEADSLMSHIRHAMHFNRVVPQEKVYLHLDNMGYFENEQIGISDVSDRYKNKYPVSSIQGLFYRK